jgi:hypothetical protein
MPSYGQKRFCFPVCVRHYKTHSDWKRQLKFTVSSPTKRQFIRVRPCVIEIHIMKKRVRPEKRNDPSSTFTTATLISGSRVITNTHTRKVSLHKQRSPIHQHRYSPIPFNETRLTAQLTVLSTGMHNDGAVQTHTSARPSVTCEQLRGANGIICQNLR